MKMTWAPEFYFQYTQFYAMSAWFADAACFSRTGNGSLSWVNAGAKGQRAQEPIKCRCLNARDRPSTEFGGVNARIHYRNEWSEGTQCHLLADRRRIERAAVAQG